MIIFFFATGSSGDVLVDCDGVFDDVCELLTVGLLLAVNPADILPLGDMV